MMKITQIHSKYSNGYTLVELLFIIVILAILASLTLSTYQQRMSNFKIDKTAWQMEQYLQAASAFYNDNNCWPSNVTHPICFGIPPNFNLYLPIGTDTNPWGGKYTYFSNAGTFQVQTSEVPQQAAQQMVSRLPNANFNCQQSHCTITATLGDSTNIALVIKSIKTFTDITDRTSKNTDFFNCPSGWTPHATTAINSIRADEGGFQEETCVIAGQGSLMISDLYTSTPNCVAIPGGPYNVCSFTITSQAMRPLITLDPWSTCTTYGSSNLGNVAITAITYCTNPRAQLSAARS